MTNVGYRVFSKVVRPPQDLIEKFRELPVANISDCMGRLACMDTAIKGFNKVKLIGPALTVRTPMADNLMFHKAIDMAEPGDIIVVNAQGDMNHSVCGEIMFRHAMSRGVSGFLIDGCIRDAAALEDMGFSVYARGANPKGPYKNGPGEINVDIACGGQAVHPGDIILGDEDGVVVIRPEDTAAILEKTLKLNQNEANVFAKIKAKNWDRSWVDKTLKETGCEFVDE